MCDTSTLWDSVSGSYFVTKVSSALMSPCAYGNVSLSAIISIGLYGPFSNLAQLPVRRIDIAQPRVHLSSSARLFLRVASYCLTDAVYPLIDISLCPWKTGLSMFGCLN